MKTPAWTWDEIKSLRIDQLANQPTFLFLWVGCGTGLEKGREAMRKWGYKRCEDVTWIKTNRNNPTNARSTFDGAVLQVKQ